MIKPERFGTIMNLGMNLVIGIVLTFVALTRLHALAPLQFVQSVISSLGIGFLIGDLLPAVPWANKLAAKVKNKFLSHVVMTLVISACLVTAISFVCQFAAFGSGMMPIWLMCLPAFYVYGTIAIFLALPVMMKIAIALTGFDPSRME